MRSGGVHANSFVPGSSAAILQDFELPRVAWLKPNLAAACFGLMKLLPARHMIESAESSGLLKEGMRIIETTSGTFGVALAMVCSRKPYDVTIVTDIATDERLRSRMEQLGAQVETVTCRGSALGFQGARLSRLHELLTAESDMFWPNQYDNPLNASSYEPVADYLLSRLGRLDVLIGPVGTGGSMAGIAHRLHELGMRTTTVAVDTCNSVLFGQADGPRLLRGLGNSLLPRNLDHRAFDFVSWVPAAEAFIACRELHGEYGLFMGPTSGAAFKVARWWADCYPDMKIVMLCPDEGHRYIDSVYNDIWFGNITRAAGRSMEPAHIAHPTERQGEWALMGWRRRTWDEVTGRSAEGLTYG